MTIEQMIAKTRANCECILCSAKPVQHVGAFTPDDPEKWPGGPINKGKKRVVTYGLCGRCLREGGSPEELLRKVEAVFQAERVVADEGT